MRHGDTLVGRITTSGAFSSTYHIDMAVPMLTTLQAIGLAESLRRQVQEWYGYLTVFLIPLFVIFVAS